MVAAGIARRLITGERLVMWETAGTFTLFTDPEVQEIHARSVLLPGSELKKRRTGAAMFFQMVAVISLLVPIGVALWRLGFGDPSTVKWMRLAANAITLVVMLPAWRLLKYFNAVTGEIMRQSIQTKATDDDVMESVQVIG
jgi:hypothetical protein